MAARPLSFNTLKELLPFLVILVSIALAWGALTTQQALTNQKLDDILTQETHFNNQLDTMAVEQNHQAQDLAVIKQILQHNNLSENSNADVSKDIARIPLALSTPQNTSAEIKPSPAPQPSSTTINTFFVEPTPTPNTSPSVIPTIVPTPTPQRILCVVNLCI